MKICFQYAGTGAIHATESPTPPPVTRQPEAPEDPLTRATKRARLARVAAVAALTALCATGCGESVAPPAARADAPAGEPAAAAPPEAKKTRSLVTGHVLPTSAVNLIADPGFHLLGYEQGFGSFLAFYNAGDVAEVKTSTDSRSPAGFGGRVAIMKDVSATDAKSRPMTMLASFAGGAGPFRVQLWVSKSDVRGRPVALPTDKGALTVTVASGAPGTSEAFDLKPEAAATRTAGDRVWVLYRAEIREPLSRGGFFMIETGDTGGQWHFAAPELVPEPLLAGQPVRALSSRASAAPRMLSRQERDAAKRYLSIPPRLVPAARGEAARMVR